MFFVYFLVWLNQLVISLRADSSMYPDGRNSSFVYTFGVVLDSVLHLFQFVPEVHFGDMSPSSSN